MNPGAEGIMTPKVDMDKIRKGAIKGRDNPMDFPIKKIWRRPKNHRSKEYDIAWIHPDTPLRGTSPRLKFLTIQMTLDRKS